MLQIRRRRIGGRFARGTIAIALLSALLSAPLHGVLASPVFAQHAPSRFVPTRLVPTQHDAPRTDSRWPRRIGTLGCPAPQWTDAPGRRVVIVGDSLTREGRKPLVRALKADGWNPTVRCWGGTRLDWARDQIRQAKRKDQLPQDVVIALGTNDMRWIDRTRTKARMEALMDEIGPDRRVVWVDTFASGGDRFTKAKQRWFNAQLAELAKERPNLTVARWGAYAKKTRVRFADALHYTPAGERAWAAFVSGALGPATQESASPS